MESICEDSDIVAANIKVCFYITDNFHLGIIMNSCNFLRTVSTHSHCDMSLRDLEEVPENKSLQSSLVYQAGMHWSLLREATRSNFYSTLDDS